MWFSLLLVVFGALLDNFSYLQSVIDQKYYGITGANMMAISVNNRLIGTSTR